MPISLVCPGCCKDLTAPDSALGKRLRCPACQTVFDAPTELSAALPPTAGTAFDAGTLASNQGQPPPGAGEPPPAGVFDAEEIGAEELRDESGAAAAAGSESPFAPAEQDRRPCSICGEMIVATAAKCRFCGAIFDPALRLAEEKRRAAAKGRVKPEDADMTGGDWVFCILCAGIACIFGIVYAIQGKPKGAKMIGVSIAAAIVWNVIKVIVQSNSR